MYKICVLNNHNIPLPARMSPMRLLEAVKYLDESTTAHNKLIPVSETRFDIVFQEPTWSSLLVDMILYWDEYWDDWESYNEFNSEEKRILLQDV